CMSGSSSIQVPCNEAWNNQASKAKSLFQNILHVSYCESRFYICLTQLYTRKSLKISNFHDALFSGSSQPGPNPLFQNILTVSSFSSIFCGDEADPPPATP